MSLRKWSTRLGKSPLSRINDDNTEIEGTAANPIVVEEALVKTSKGARKRQKLDKNVCVYEYCYYSCGSVLWYLILLDSTRQ
jgi:hypothetical protein